MSINENLAHEVFDEYRPILMRYPIDTQFELMYFVYSAREVATLIQILVMTTAGRFSNDGEYSDNIQTGLDAASRAQRSIRDYIEQFKVTCQRGDTNEMVHAIETFNGPFMLSIRKEMKVLMDAQITEGYQIPKRLYDKLTEGLDD